MCKKIIVNSKEMRSVVVDSNDVQSFIREVMLQFFNTSSLGDFLVFDEKDFLSETDINMRSIASSVFAIIYEKQSFNILQPCSLIYPSFAIEILKSTSFKVLAPEKGQLIVNYLDLQARKHLELILSPKTVTAIWKTLQYFSYLTEPIENTHIAVYSRFDDEERKVFSPNELLNFAISLMEDRISMDSQQKDTNLELEIMKNSQVLAILKEALNKEMPISSFADNMIFEHTLRDPKAGKIIDKFLKNLGYACLKDDLSNLYLKVEQLYIPINLLVLGTMIIQYEPNKNDLIKANNKSEISNEEKAYLIKYFQ